MREVCVKHCIHNAPVQIRLDTIETDVRNALADHRVSTIGTNEETRFNDLLSFGGVVDDVYGDGMRDRRVFGELVVFGSAGTLDQDTVTNKITMMQWLE